MGKQCRGKKAEKLGTGKVTPVQVAFIVDRYLSENHFNQTVNEFRQEAASILGGNKPKQAPRGMLSLVDILDEYITLKEQRLALNHEKCRVDQLLHSIQDIIHAYHSGPVTPLPSVSHLHGSASASMASSQAEVASAPIAGSVALAPVSAASSAPSATRSALPVPSNKRKSPTSVTAPSKKLCLAPSQSCHSNEKASTNTSQAPFQICSTTSTAHTHSANVNVQYSACDVVSVGQKDQQFMAKQVVNQSSPPTSNGTQKKLSSDASSPQTPPQAFPSSSNSASPPETSAPVSDPSVCLAETSDKDQLKVCNAPLKNKASPSGKPSSKSGTKRGNVKSRLDFNSSASSNKSPIKQRTEQALLDFPDNFEVNDDLEFDLSDIPSLDVDIDDFMADLFSDYQGFQEQSSDAGPRSDKPSMSVEENFSNGNAHQSLLSRDSAGPGETAVLAEKNMNIEVVSAALKTLERSNGAQMHSTKDARHKNTSHGQENVPIC